MLRASVICHDYLSVKYMLRPLLVKRESERETHESIQPALAHEDADE